MQAANRIQKALRTAPNLTFGAWQMLPGSNHARTVAQCGFDWVCVDTEHGNIDDGAMHEAVAAIAACGVSPIVRVAANEGWSLGFWRFVRHQPLCLVTEPMTKSAHGIIVPLLETAEDARKLVRSAKFPPQGNRGFGSPFAMERFGGVSMTEYLQQSNDALVTIVQVETKEALDNVDSIARVPGIDCLFVGPFDLGNNIGRPIIDNVMQDELKEAISTIHRAAKDNQKSSGIYSTSGEQAREFADQGFNMISAVTDMVALPKALAEALTSAKGSYMHSAAMAGKDAVSGVGRLVSGR